MKRDLCIVVIIVFVQCCEAKSKTRVISIEKCKISDSKWDKDNMLEVSWSTNRVTRQTTLVYGNITVKHKVGPVSIGLRTYLVKQDSSRNLVFKIEKVSCKKPLVTQLLRSLQLNIDDKCYFLPSSIVLSNGINVDDYSWLLTNTATTPGKYNFEMDFTTDKGYIVCVDILCNILDLM